MKKKTPDAFLKLKDYTRKHTRHFLSRPLPPILGSVTAVSALSAEGTSGLQPTSAQQSGWLFFQTASLEKILGISHLAPALPHQFQENSPFLSLLRNSK